MPRILVGGDNDTAANMHAAIRHDLSGQQFSAYYCTNPRELLHQLESGGANLIVLHYEFAAETNVEIYRRLREHPAATGIPILMLHSEFQREGTDIVDPRLGKLAEPVTKVGLFEAIGNRLGFSIACEDHVILSVESIPEEALLPQTREEEAESVPDVSSTRLSLSGEVNIRRYGDGDNLFYMIPETFRKRWFYGSDIVQTLLDWVEDTSTYQNFCRRHDGRAPESRERRRELKQKRKSMRPSRKERREIRKKARQEQTEKTHSCLLARAVLILVFLIVGGGLSFAGAIAYEMLSDKTPDDTIVAEVQCSICGFHEAYRVKNIHDERCRKCSGELGFCYTCGVCGKTFAYIPEKSGVKQIKQVTEPPLCPFCKEASAGKVTLFQPHFSAFD